MSTLVGCPAPDFSASAVLASGEIQDEYILSKAISGRYAVIFFYPLDFTFVCPSELIALNNRIDEFKNRNIEVITVSVDSQFTHAAWRNTPVASGGIGPVKYTMVADISHSICRAYGVEHPEASVAYRGTFIVDKTGLIRVAMVNDLPIGRNSDEIIRLVDAIELNAVHGEVCPAGWTTDKPSMQPTKEGVAKYMAENATEL